MPSIFLHETLVNSNKVEELQYMYTIGFEFCLVLLDRDGRGGEVALSMACLFVCITVYFSIITTSFVSSYKSLLKENNLSKIISRLIISVKN